MEQINFIELIGNSNLSLGDAIEDAIGKSGHSSPKHMEVIETHASTQTNQSNYKVKLKVAAQEIA